MRKTLDLHTEPETTGIERRKEPGVKRSLLVGRMISGPRYLDSGISAGEFLETFA
jgi:hypothetical protein